MQKITHTPVEILATVHKLAAEVEAKRLTIAESTETDRKKSRGFRITTQTEINNQIMRNEEIVSDLVYNRLADLEQYKNADGTLPQTKAKEVHELFLILCAHGGRLNSRYVKMPKEWTWIGQFAGILEDLIVILRTPMQIGLGEKHVYSFEELFAGFRDFLGRELAEGKTYPRFMFFTRLLENPSDSEITKTLIRCIKSQGNSKRIGYIDNGSEYGIYAIQGILGNVQFDDRVTKLLTLDNCPEFAVHFTKETLALSIWSNEQTTSTKRRPSGEPIYPGHICKFERPIHALTNIKFSDGKYRIFNVDKDIRDRMAHGIKEDVERPKYQAGLVIDVKKVINHLPAGSIRMNEIGTLLVNGDIPHECLLHCISSEEDVEAFWAGA